MDLPSATTLRGIVIAATGHDVRRCGRCSYCVKHAQLDHDVSLEALLQMVTQNDDEVLTSRTLWSDDVLKQARRMCISTMDVPAIILALRSEARQRGRMADEE
jgi:hypothetical protein